MKYVAIDCETTGLDPETCDLVEVAAVLEDTAELRPIEELPALRLVLTTGQAGDGTFRGTPAALAMHGRLWAELAAWRAGAEWPGRPTAPPFASPDSAAYQLRQFLDRHGLGLDRPVTLAGKNLSTFDLRFLRRLPRWRSLIPFRHRILDPGPMYVRPEDDAPPDLAECCRRAGIPAPEGHEALADARAVVRLIRRHWGLERLELRCSHCGRPARGAREGGDCGRYDGDEGPPCIGTFVIAAGPAPPPTPIRGGAPAADGDLPDADLARWLGVWPAQIREEDLLEVEHGDGAGGPRRVRMAPWRRDDGTWMVMLDGVGGPVALDRCRYLGGDGR